MSEEHAVSVLMDLSHLPIGSHVVRARTAVQGQVEHVASVSQGKNRTQIARRVRAAVLGLLESVECAVSVLTDGSRTRTRWRA